MRRSTFSEEQIIALPREQEAGLKTGDVCRKHGVNSATLYKWKAAFGGLDVSQARKPPGTPTSMWRPSSTSGGRRTRQAKTAAAP